MSTPTQPQTGAEVMAQFIPSSPFVVKLGIVADVLDADEVRLRLPWDPTNVPMRNATSAPKSHIASPMRLSGMQLMVLRYWSGPASRQIRMPSDSASGQMTLTRIPSAPHSIAATLDKPRIASLALA
jgi:hypothetical protein